ncbi:NAD(P)-dependent dehydrogenase (short-subunit alcohol dehydrogenase family) [Pararhizobium capsulatum DSM 1112]|uniref:3-dehydrosphinganine reductase n=1 Tax=Pararhizobium capsulatum DSM 1112 TaxID=1121113 RepID=A0ABU0BL09_9HYPH|nr:SDR family oxidoreductase [Pararhizobium capsulatum]MDQ0318927.1 NAD(P)-dependent dehydrogenase (short-subunit alcohol dehydrogenase family) [Pararhizobium capsulatum DSM 1112]
MAHVIVTGGSSGIGLAVARIFVARGDRVSLLARTPALLQSARDGLLAVHPNAQVCVESVDVSRETAVVDAVDRCEARFGACDILVASAGIVQPGLFEAISAEAFNRQIETNLTGSVNAARAVYAAMKTRRSGRIMLVSSGAGLIGIYGYSAYSASKFALHGFAEALRSEAQPHGVKISVCFPPDTETPQFARELDERPLEAAVVMGRVAPWSADVVASRIVRAIDRGIFEVFFGPTLYGLGRFGSLIKPLLNWWLDRAIGRITRR